MLYFHFMIGQHVRLVKNLEIKSYFLVNYLDHSNTIKTINGIISSHENVYKNN